MGCVKDMWITLVPIIVGSAVVPIQIIITILLLRSSSGRFTAVAWVAGMATVRLLQGLVFGLILDASDEPASSNGGHGYLAPTLLLLVAVLFFVVAVKQLLHQPDDDAPPPKWLAKAEALTPVKAYLLGAGLLVIGLKFWVFTLGAIAAIADAPLGRAGSIGAFLLFVALAQSIQLGLLGVAYLAPARADALLTRFSEQLTRSNRVIVIALGLVFGTWFTLKALGGFGII